MTTPDHEYMDTGSLTPDAVPAPVEAPGSESSDGEAPLPLVAQEHEGSEGPDSDLPHGAETVSE